MHGTSPGSCVLSQPDEVRGNTCHPWGSYQERDLGNVVTGHLEAESTLGLMEEFVPRCSILILSTK